MISMKSEKPELLNSWRLLAVCKNEIDKRNSFCKEYYKDLSFLCLNLFIFFPFIEISVFFIFFSFKSLLTICQLS